MSYIRTCIIQPYSLPSTRSAGQPGVYSPVAGDQLVFTYRFYLLVFSERIIEYIQGVPRIETRVGRVALQYDTADKRSRINRPFDTQSTIDLTGLSTLNAL